MRVLHVFTASQSAYFFLEGQLKYLQNKGVEFSVILPFDGYFSAKIIEREKDVDFYKLNFSREINLLNDFKSLIILTRLIILIKPDIIHLHTPKASLLGGFAGRLLFKRNIIYQMHGLVSLRGDKVNNKLLYLIEKLTCFLSTKIYSVSESLRQAAIKNNYCKPSKIVTINNGTINGIDFDKKFNRDLLIKNQIREIPQDTFVIGFLGRVSQDKGIFDFLKVLQLLKVEKFNVFGVIIGPDESNNKFNNFLDQLNLVEKNDFIFLGQQLDPEKYIQNFDVLMLPTVREGFGLAAAEANSLSVPFIGYNIPGIRDAILNNQTGLLVDLDDIESLKNAVVFYIQNPRIKKDHGKKGAERVKKLFRREDLWEKIYDSYIKLLN